MSHTETHSVILIKTSQRRLQEKVIQANRTNLISSVINKSMSVRGWSIDPELDSDGNGWVGIENPEADGYVYSMFLTVTFSREDDKKPGTNEFASLVHTLNNRAGQPPFGKWTVGRVDGTAYVAPADGDDISANINADLIGYADVVIPDNWDSYFAHLYGRDAHVERVKLAIEAGIMSDWKNRFHCVLTGPPGCGKSDICSSLKRALGDDAVMEYDATATTAAGMIKELSERDILPRIMVVEEAEKSGKDTLQPLLALMDTRGELNKTTARGKIQRDVKMLVIMTVNNYDLFREMQAGALESRTANKIGFSRPDREQLAMILEREVTKIGGDEQWIKPALDYCEERDITDPRQVISLCLCGREKLITGEYQKMLEETAL